MFCCILKGCQCFSKSGPWATRSRSACEDRFQDRVPATRAQLRGAASGYLCQQAPPVTMHTVPENCRGGGGVGVLFPWFKAEQRAQYSIFIISEISKCALVKYMCNILNVPFTKTLDSLATTN